MKRLAPSERVMVCYALTRLLGDARVKGAISLYVSERLTLTFTADQIWAVINKLEVLDDLQATQIDAQSDHSDRDN